MPPHSIESICCPAFALVAAAGARWFVVASTLVTAVIRCACLPAIQGTEPAIALTVFSEAAPVPGPGDFRHDAGRAAGEGLGRTWARPGAARGWTGRRAS